MTTQEKIEAIREKCIAANPAIMELGFGCEVETRDGKICKYVVDDQYANAYGKFCFLCDSKHRYFEIENFKILGRPIRLDDTRQIIRQEYWGELIEIWRDGLLSDQPEVVIEWIVKNIAPLD